MITYGLQELVSKYGEDLLFDSREVVEAILGDHDMVVLDPGGVPEVLQFLCQGSEGDWMLILSKKCSLFPVMGLSTCYDLGSFSLLLGS